MKKTGDLITFLKEHDILHGSWECPPRLNLNAPLIIDPRIKNKIKCKFSIFKGYIYTQGISAILTINAPKYRERTANCGNVEIFKKCNVFELGCAFRLNSANYKRNNQTEKANILIFAWSTGILNWTQKFPIYMSQNRGEVKN